MNHRFGTVETVITLHRPFKEVWDTVCFYEHVATRPSWFLRAVLPIPLRTTGCYGKVGDESRCLYSDGGYLAKRITRIGEGRVDFDIIEQTIRYHTRIALCGGTIEIGAVDSHACTVRMITRYEFRARWLNAIRPFVAMTVSSMHRFVMRDMLQRLSAQKIKFVHATVESMR